MKISSDSFGLGASLLPLLIARQLLHLLLQLLGHAPQHLLLPALLRSGLELPYMPLYPYRSTGCVVMLSSVSQRL